MTTSSLPHTLSSSHRSDATAANLTKTLRRTAESLYLQLQRSVWLVQALARHRSGRILLLLVTVLLLVVVYASSQLFNSTSLSSSPPSTLSDPSRLSLDNGMNDDDSDDSDGPMFVGRLTTEAEDEEATKAHASADAEHRDHLHRRRRTPSRHQRPSTPMDSENGGGGSAHAEDGAGGEPRLASPHLRPAPRTPRHRHLRVNVKPNQVRGEAIGSHPPNELAPDSPPTFDADEPARTRTRLVAPAEAPAEAPAVPAETPVERDESIADEVFAAPLPADLDSVPVAPQGQSCSAYLSLHDAVAYKRDFTAEPIRVGGSIDKTLDDCDVPCIHSGGSGGDATFHGSSAGTSPTGPFSVMRNMESVTNYPSLDTEQAHASGVDVVMTTHLDSDVPAGYFSWVEYRMMKEVTEKNWNRAPTVAFISNCGAQSFRLRCIQEFQTLGVAVDSYGACLRNSHTSATKMQTIRSYPFTLAFENSQEMDYTTEKYFQALEAGSVPIVIGSLNADDYAPAPNSHLVVRTPEDIPQVAERVKYLLSNRTAYDEMLAWKQTGPHEPFLALVDMAVVHSDCRLCVWTATELRRREFKQLYPDATPLPAPTRAASAHSTPMYATKDRPCRCRDSSAMVAGASPASQLYYHVYVRERGRFTFQSIFLRHDQLTVDGLEAAIIEAFAAISLRPLWTRERSSFQRVNIESTNPRDWYRVYRVYPAHDTTQRKALYENTAQLLNGDVEVATWVQAHPCGELEVVLV